MTRTWLRAAIVVIVALVVLAEARDADERNDERARAAEMAVV